jgi:hypothetical protein
VRITFFFVAIVPRLLGWLRSKCASGSRLGGILA